MSVGPVGGLVGAAAGARLAQSSGSDVERAKQESNDQQRSDKVTEKADKAAGIGQTDGEDHQTGERDADGRRIWEGPDDSGKQESEEPEEEQPTARQSRSANGESGNQLDLTG